MERRFLTSGAVLTAAYLFRLAVGLRHYWDEDARQVYLLGLKYATTDAWPYYGPDVVYSQSQIPGALQGLLVGVPLRLLPLPSAPFLLLNLISLAALVLLGWYIRRRIPTLPAWFVWGVVLTAPWMLFFSTSTVNPDYLLLGAVLAAVGLYEASPRISGNLLPAWLAWMMVGFGVGWIMQLHLSWVVLLPLIGYGLVTCWQLAPRRAVSGLAWLLAGFLLPASLLLPTLVHGGPIVPAGNVALSSMNPAELLVTIVARFLSFASYELPYFMGSGRLEFLARHLWATPGLVLLLVVGHLQPVVLLLAGFRPRTHEEWPAVRSLTVLLVVTLFLAFLFSIKGPSSHTFYLAAPFAMLYSMYCWEPWLARTRWRRLAAAAVISGIITGVVFMFEYHPDRSFATDREAVRRALTESNYRLLGTRRAEEWGCCY